MQHDGCVGCMYEKEPLESGYCVGCKQNAIDKYKRMTNADRIRQMTDDDLAHFISGLKKYESDGEWIIRFFYDKFCGDTFEDVKEWLEGDIYQ